MTNSSTGGNHFSQIPEKVLYADISDGAYRLYGALARIVDTKTWQGYALVSTLAKRINRSESAVNRSLRELREKKLITVQNQWTDGKKYSTKRREGWRQTSNLYTLHLNVRGGDNDTPIESATPAAVSSDRGGGGDNDMGVGVNNDRQYDSPHIPEPIESINPPVEEVPLSRDENQFFGDEEIVDELPASRQETLADQREPMPEDIRAIIQETFLDRPA